MRNYIAIGLGLGALATVALAMGEKVVEARFLCSSGVAPH